MPSLLCLRRLGLRVVGGTSVFIAVSEEVRS